MKKLILLMVISGALTACAEPDKFLDQKGPETHSGMSVACHAVCYDEVTGSLEGIPKQEFLECVCPWD